MTDPRHAFLRAIEQDFDSDVPRLVFADWLDENGEPARARYIRLECETARMRVRTQADRDGYWRLAEEGRALVEAHFDEWTAGLPAWAGPTVAFHRGFVLIDHFTARQLLADGAAVRAVTPFAASISVERLKGREAAVFGCEHLAAVTGLSLANSQLTDAGVGHLVASPHLGRLRQLRLNRSLDGVLPAAHVNRLTDAAAVALAATPNLPALTELTLPGFARLTGVGVRAVLESPRRAGLTSLNVSGGPGGPAFAELFRSPRLRVTGLRELNVGGRRLGDAGAVVLAGCPALAGLTELHLHDNRLGDAGAAAVLESAHLTGVRWLDVSGNPGVTDATARRVLADRRPWEWVAVENTGVSGRLQQEIRTRCQGYA